MIKVLFIDDDRPTQNTLKMILPDNYIIISAYSSREGIERLKQETIDIILLDIDLPDRDGIKTLKEIKTTLNPPPVVMLTVLSNIGIIVEAIREGAYDYIVKPYKLNELIGTIKRALENHFAYRNSKVPQVTDEAFREIIGISNQIITAKALAARYATTDATILITGESGTGKELMAKAIHLSSPRKEAPFIAINCANLAPNLIGSELFGSERGAFTDALSKPGLLEEANGGTIFLDEIGELGENQQAALLRVLEEKRVRRIGSRSFKYVNIRVITATNRNLKAMTEEKTFRKDLFFRISVLPIEMPSLRSRREDIPILATHFLKLMDKTKKLTEGAKRTLADYPWPGNVRELKNVIERTTLLTDRRIIEASDITF